MTIPAIPNHKIQEKKMAGKSSDGKMNPTLIKSVLYPKYPIESTMYIKKPIFALCLVIAIIRSNTEVVMVK